MQVTLESAQRRIALSRLAPVACGCALAGAAAYVGVHDPAEGGYPACPLYTLTGYWCPGCGLTRATHHLLRAEFGAAFSANVFVLVTLGAIVGAWWMWLRAAWGRPPLRVPKRFGVLTAVVLPVALVAYGVLRNIPSAPFRALAP